MVYLKTYIQMSTRERMLVRPFASASSSGITAGSGSNPSPGKDLPSSSKSPFEENESRTRRHILIVEDSRADVFLIRESIRAAKLDADIQVVQDGEKAIRVFEDADRDPSAPCPALVILDINLPKKQGREVLQALRNSRRCADALVLVVTSSNSEKDREDMAKLGARDYFCKPSAYAEFMKLGQVIKTLLDGGAGRGSPGTLE